MAAVFLAHVPVPQPLAPPSPSWGFATGAAALPSTSLNTRVADALQVRRTVHCRTCGLFAGAPALRPSWRSRDDRSSSGSLSLAAMATVSAAVAGGAAAARSQSSRGGSAPSGRPAAAGRQKRASKDAANAVDFGGLQVWGTAADWIRAQQRRCGGRFAPSAIQAEAMLPIFKGESVALQAPTGTGKTLAYMLPLLMRMETLEASKACDSMRMLILVPTADLQLQIAAVARQLLGPERAPSVVVVRRDADNTKITGSIIVATPRQIMGMINNRQTSRVWCKALMGLEICVVDEADRLVARWNKHQQRRRYHAGLDDPCPQVLQAIAREKAEWRGEPLPDLQLVAASATVNRNTQRKLKYSAGVDLDLIRAEGAKLPEFASSPSGQYDDGTSSWPEGLRHTVRVLKNFLFPKVITSIVQTVLELESPRTLVILGEAPGKTGPGSFGLAPVTAQLRFRLENSDIQVTRCSEAVEAAAAAWQSGGPSLTKREVMVGTSRAMRGIHLDNVGAVVIVGDINNVNEYVHCAGRTCRLRPGDVVPRGGSVVSITPENVANRMMNWGKLTGFTIVEVPLRDRHPPVEVQDETPPAPMYVAPSAADNAAGTSAWDDDSMFVEESVDNEAVQSADVKDASDEEMGIAGVGAWG